MEGHVISKLLEAKDNTNIHVPSEVRTRNPII